MIRYAKDCGIPFVNSCTNGDAVNPEKLIESGIDEISFQIDQRTGSVQALDKRSIF